MPLIAKKKSSTFYDQFRAKAARAVRNAVEMEADFVRSDIDTPVGSTGGSSWGRSLPGQPPRLETGELHASIRSPVTIHEDFVRGSVSAGTEYAPTLEFELNRPFMSTSRIRFRSEGVKAIVEALRL